jgi:hypothetical protein
MTDPSGYRVRLRVWLAKSLNAQDLSRIVNLAGRVVTIVSQEGGQQLADANWIVLQARGFASEEEANHFGTQLRTITELAGVCCRLGVNVGHGRPPLWMNEEFARSMGLIQPHERLHPNVHGLAILPDDDLTRFPLVHIEATVRADPAQFEGALTELAAGQWVQLSAAAEGVRLLNLALLNPQPLAQAVLAISAVEALGQDQEWTDAQTALLAQLAAQVEAGTSGQGDERMEIADALRRGLHRFGLRQGVMRVLARLELQHLRKEWDRVYGIRSGLFHGTAQLAEHEIAELATSAITLCGRIILTLAERDGVTLPSVTDVHFPKAQG